MTSKEYLQQGYRIDQRINSKIAQVTNLRELATKATATLSDMPGNATPNTHRMEDIIVKMVDLENEINADIDSLVDLKAEMVSVIKNVRNPELQTLLELRYLCTLNFRRCLNCVICVSRHGSRLLLNWVTALKAFTGCIGKH